MNTHHRDHHEQVIPRLNSRIAFFESNIETNTRIGAKADCCIWNTRSSSDDRLTVRSNSFATKDVVSRGDACLFRSRTSCGVKATASEKVTPPETAKNAPDLALPQCSLKQHKRRLSSSSLMTNVKSQPLQSYSEEEVLDDETDDTSTAAACLFCVCSHCF